MMKSEQFLVHFLAMAELRENKIRAKRAKWAEKINFQSNIVVLSKWQELNEKIDQIFGNFCWEIVDLST